MSLNNKVVLKFINRFNRDVIFPNWSGFTTRPDFLLPFQNPLEQP
jgi:hypothetical protein